MKAAHNITRSERKLHRDILHQNLINGVSIKIQIYIKIKKHHHIIIDSNMFHM